MSTIRPHMTLARTPMLPLMQRRILRIAALALLAASCGGDDPDLSPLRGVWHAPSPFFIDSCGWPGIEISDTAVRFLIAKSLTLSCYRIQRVSQNGSLYSLSLQEVSTIGPGDTLEAIAQQAAIAEEKCAAGLAAGPRKGAQTQLVVEVRGDTMKIQVSPDGPEFWLRAEVTRAPQECRRS